MTADRHAEFVALLEPERDALWRFARRMCWDKSAAEDCLQEASIIAYRKFDVFTRGTSFRAWTFRILINVILNANSQVRRSLRVRAPVSDLDLVAALEREEAYQGVLDDPDTFLDRVSDPVRRAVKGLPAHERMVFLLRAVENFSYREIADFLSIPMGTVMSHLFRSRTRLRELLADYVRDAGFARNPS
jgi:RNA polymerase sigma-70 factor (ECF subfamily)